MLRTVKFLLNKWNIVESTDQEAQEEENALIAGLKGDEILVDNVQLFGTVDDEVLDDFITIRTEDDEVHHVNSLILKIKLIKGDKVRLNGFWKEEDFGTSKIFEVKSIDPSDTKEEYGRVTSVNQTYIVFDERFLLLLNSYDEIPELKMHQECKFFTILSNQVTEGSHYKWRVLKLLEVNELPNAEVVANGIIMRDLKIKVILDTSFTKDKCLCVVNKTGLVIKLIDVKFQSKPNQFIRLIHEQMKTVTIEKQQGTYHKFLFRIFPRQQGTFTYEFSAKFQVLDMEVIEKRCKIVLEVLKGKEVINGERSLPTPRFIAIRFEDYHVPDDLRMIDFTSVNVATEELLTIYPVLNEELRPENYLKKLKLGIYLEEIAIEQAFNTFHNKRAQFKNVDDLLRLEVKDVAEKRPSIIFGDKIWASDPKFSVESQRYEGIIKKVENDAILVEFTKDFHESHVGKEFSIDFKFSRRLFKQNHHAIKTILSSGLGFDFLFPKMEKIESRNLQLYVKLADNGKLKLFNKERSWFDQKLNQHQKEAVVNILRGECRPFPYILYGPPGTGKTLTVIEIIMQLFFLDPTTQIIVATPSNSTANSLVEALIKTKRFNDSHDFIRFVSNNQINKGLIPPELEKYCGTIGIGENDETFYNANGIRINCNKSKISNYRICIGTLSAFGSLMNINIKNHFTHVIIDEAGQSIEPETLIPITLLKKRTGQVILSGDPKQLGPMSISRIVKTFKLDVSFLERLLDKNECYAKFYGPNKKDYDPRFVTKLKINYRSLPSVLQLYNNMFYDCELECAISEDESSEADLLSIIEPILWKNDAKNPNCGIYFVNVVNGKNRKEADSCSWYNEGEIHAVMSFLQKLPEGFDLKNVGIITPYALQVKKIKLKISDILLETDLKVGTVEEFQGQERNIICLSTVRSAEKFIGLDRRFGLGFLNCHKRMNVAISRARSLLIVFGKADILRKDIRWNELIDFTIRNNTFFDDQRK